MGDYTYLEITCADWESFLRKITDKGIILYDLDRKDLLTIKCKCASSDTQVIKIIAERCGGNVKYRAAKGISILFGWVKIRPFLVIVLLLLFIMTLYLPTRILFVRVEGNAMIPANLILEEAEKSGICFGACRRQVRSEQVKNILIDALPQLQWIGINTSGCVATISVREKSVEETSESFPGIGSIVAARDGVITDCTVTNGTALCKAGDAVIRGQTLVSGYIDCGIAIKTVRAEAEVSAYTLRDFEAVTLNTPLQRGAVTHIKTKYSILLGKKLINLYKGSGISDTTCVKMYSEDYLTLPGGFQLPVALVTQTEIYYSVAEGVNAQWEWMPSYAKQYLLSHMQAGQILGEDVQMQPADSVVDFKGHYICRELIGQFMEEEIVHEYGQTD